MATGFGAERLAKLKAEAIADEELRIRLAGLTADGLKLWARQCLTRLRRGEPIDGLPWRALVDVRLAQRGTPDGRPLLQAPRDAE